MYDAGLYDPLEEEDEVCLKPTPNSYEAEQTVSFLVHGVWWWLWLALHVHFTFSVG